MNGNEKFSAFLSSSGVTGRSRFAAILGHLKSGFREVELGGASYAIDGLARD
jgi:hypothetical protein